MMEVTWSRSDSLDKFAPALVAAQGKLAHVAKESRVDTGQFAYSYASLANVLDAIREAFTPEGFALLMLPQPAEPGVVAVQAVLLHASDQWTACTVSMPCPKADPKSYGSVLSYIRRYAACCITGLASQDDEKKLPGEKRGKAAQNDRDQRKDLMGRLKVTMDELGWTAEDGRAWFEGWAGDNGVEPDADLRDIPIKKLEAFENVLGLELLKIQDPFSKEPIDG